VAQEHSKEREGMNSTVISSKQLDNKCWSAKRFLDQCEKCNLVQSCDLPSASQGRIKILQNRVVKAKTEIAEREQKIEQLLEKIGQGLAG